MLFRDRIQENKKTSDYDEDGFSSSPAVDLMIQEEICAARYE